MILVKFKIKTTYQYQSPAFIYVHESSVMNSEKKILKTDQVKRLDLRATVDGLGLASGTNNKVHADPMTLAGFLSIWLSIDVTSKREKKN